jgi:elongation factor G
MGEVHEGSTHMDWMDEERERGITITSAATTLTWKGHRINLIDTPGHVDFTAEVERSLRVLDGAIVVFDGLNGVEAQSETVWRQATRYRVPRICFINKLDKPGADFRKAIGTIASRLGARAVPVALPHMKGQEILGVVDLVARTYLTFDDNDQGKTVVSSEIPEELADEASLARAELCEAAAEHASDEILNRFFEAGDLGDDDLRAAIRASTLKLAFHPVLCSTRSSRTCRRRPTSGRSSARTRSPARRSSASSARTSRSPHWRSRRSPTRTATSRTCASTPAR